MSTTADHGFLICRDSGERYPLDAPIWRSPATGGLLDLHWPAAFPIDEIRRRPPTLWRYREALPVPDDADIVSLGEPITPLLPHTLPTARGGERSLLLKLDSLHASGSYKDRGSAVLISHCKRLRLPRVVEDSSGNAGASIAMYCARAGIPCDIYVPQSASPGKLVQVRAAGANLVRVPGSREDTARAAWDAAREIYYASHCWNPFFFHGTKTFAYEVCEQLGWKPPGSVIIPTGNGTLLIGAWIGFRDLLDAGVIDRIPRLIAVQTEACAPLARAWRTEAGETPAPTPTIAEGIAIAQPIRSAQCLEAVRASGGTIVTVSEQQITAALGAATRAGLFIEPTSATALAAAAQLGHDIAPEPVVVAITGHGLKAPGTIADALGV